jgi:hypothetical protein
MRYLKKVRWLIEREGVGEVKERVEVEVERVKK